MSKLSDFFCETTSKEFDFTDGTLSMAINKIDSLQYELLSLRGQPKDPNEFTKYVKDLIDLESESKKPGGANWSLVLDIPIENGVYKDPQVQFGSPPPNYERFVATYDKDKGLQVDHKETSILPDVDLSQVVSSNGQSLKEAKEIYDEAKIHRIAILGGARIFAEEKLTLEVFQGLSEEDQKKIKEGTKPSSLGYGFRKGDYLINPESAKWAQEKNQAVEEQLNKFANVYDRKGTELLFVNGGWAGSEEGSIGMPLISNLFGSVISAERDNTLPPVTIMPEGGSFDRVNTSADKQFPDRYHNVKDAHTYFPVKGVWGDDSPYLVGFSTGSVIFEPYGYWSKIEMSNTLAQGKPVVVIADPKKLEPGKEYEGKFANNQKYFEEDVQLPEGKTGKVRFYKDAADAARWIHEQSEIVLANIKDTK